MHILKKIIIIILLFQLVNSTKSQSVEYAVKASFIEKFARFTIWPNNLNGGFFEIVVLGKSPFNQELEKISQKMKIKNKPIRIKYITDYHEIKDSHLVFICASERNRISEIIAHIEYLNILSISDTPGFSKKGVHLNFYIDEFETIKYEVNPTALKKANLNVDLQLLNFGKIIR